MWASPRTLSCAVREQRKMTKDKHLEDSAHLEPRSHTLYSGPIAATQEKPKVQPVVTVTISP